MFYQLRVSFFVCVHVFSYSFFFFPERQCLNFFFNFKIFNSYMRSQTWTPSHLPPHSNQVFLGSWTVDIHQEGCSQISDPQKRHTAHLKRRSHCKLRKLSCWDGGSNKIHHTWGVCAHQAPGCLSYSELGRAQNAGPTKSVPLWSTQESEPEWLRPGKCTQTRAHVRQFPCRATWSLRSVDWESTHAASGGKPSVAQTLRALPTHASDICLHCFCLPTTQLTSELK